MIADHRIYSQTRDEHSSCEILAQLKDKFEYSKVSDENISNEFCYCERINAIEHGIHFLWMMMLVVGIEIYHLAKLTLMHG
jgi:hypothetical protein